MEKRIEIGLVGDFNKNMYTHVAINDAIDHCRPHLPFAVEATWIPTEKLDGNFLALNNFSAFWITPGSPYKNDHGVYELLRWGRENNIMVYGTCGGFQYMLVEYARNVLRISSAGHEEAEPGSENLIVKKLACSLKAATEKVHITDNASWLAKVMRVKDFKGKFNCSYGVNPQYQKILDQYPLTFTAFSDKNEPRAFELKAHRFYVGTLFQPQLNSTKKQPDHIVLEFLREAGLQ